MAAAEIASGQPDPTFDVLPLHPEVRQAVDELGYVHPTPVQRAAFEPATRGLDLVVQARTGTGKTASFGLPLVHSLIRKNVSAVQGLVLCPTRELALQVTTEITALAKYRGTKVVAVYGGAPMQKQIEQIEDGAQLVVGTPGRVLDHLRRGTFDPTHVRVLVLDESDEMLSMGFLPQINDVLAFLPEGHQTLLFSATVPREVKRMAETRLRNPEFITLSGDQVGALEVLHLLYSSTGDKLSEFLQMLDVEKPESAIVFCNTREQTKRVAAALVEKGYSADWLNAELSQSDREKVMAATRQGELRFLVATDVASRGIDISHLTHVLNFDVPESAESYVHRTGRTGRAGRTGTAISMVAPSDVGSVYMLRLTYGIKMLERRLPSARELKTQAEADMVASLARLFGNLMLKPDELALARRILTHEAAPLIVAGLLRAQGSDVQPAGAASVRPEARSVRPEARSVRPEARAERAEGGRSEGGRYEGPRNEAGRRDRREPRRDEPRRDEPRRDEPRRDRDEDRFRARESRGGEARTEGERRPRVRREDRDDLPRYQVEAAPITTESATVLEVQASAAAPSYTEPEKPVAPAPVREEPVSAAPAEAPNAAEATRGEFERERSEAEIFVNVGRRDGASPDDFRGVLDREGLGRDLIDYVNVRQRHTFIGLKREALARALTLLNSVEIAGRPTSAEEGRRSANSG
jgi:ATP-dependent RNA helicase DeaD